jgi:hypothetical protein
MFGLTDPYIWGAYAACIINTAFCIVYGLMRDRGSEKEEDAGDE